VKQIRDERGLPAITEDENAAVDDAKEEEELTYYGQSGFEGDMEPEEEGDQEGDLEMADGD